MHVNHDSCIETANKKHVRYELLEQQLANKRHDEFNFATTQFCLYSTDPA